MKRIIFLPFCFIFCLSFFGCKKPQDDSIAHGSSVNYSLSNGSVQNGGNNHSPFSFTGIVINPNPVHKGTASSVTATATGSNLTFKWTTSHGDLFGTGYRIYYSDSCIGTYSITCTVSDGVHSSTITVPITVSE